MGQSWPAVCVVRLKILLYNTAAMCHILILSKAERQNLGQNASKVVCWLQFPGYLVHLQDLNNITSENTRETNSQQNNYKKTFRTPLLPRIYDNNRKYFNPPKIVLLPSLASFSEYELYQYNKT